MPDKQHSLNLSAGLASVAVSFTLVVIKAWALSATGALSIAASLAACGESAPEGTEQAAASEDVSNDTLASELAAAGSLTGSVNRYSALKTRLASEASELTEAQEELRARMVSRFAGVDSQVGSHMGKQAGGGCVVAFGDGHGGLRRCVA